MTFIFLDVCLFRLPQAFQAAELHEEISIIFLSVSFFLALSSLTLEQSPNYGV